MPLIETRETDAHPHPVLSDGAQAPERLAGRKNLLQLIQMRWLAVAGQFATILTVQYVLGVRLPMVEMLTLLTLLTLFNIASWLRSRLALPVNNSELFAGLLVDVGVLTGQLYYSGGVTNPFIYLYLLQVAVGTVLLRPRYIWAIVVATSLCFVALTQWHLPLTLPDMFSPALSTQYIGGLLICFLLNASLLVIFIGRIGRNLRQRDATLADLRQRAAEEEHIVRMGLLASGAAHELGTPLATLSVILGDWARMAPFAAEPELREEIEEMQVQLQRCKSIVSGILLSAGEARGEAPAETTLHEFLDNVLDNALEAAPKSPLYFIAECDDDMLTLRVLDQGPGFPPAMLERFGTPYQSSKSKPGGGLGLFLSVNVARTLGGRIEARNRMEGGAEVIITLPLTSLMPTEWTPHER